jgi:2-methylcitrate dehydratase PrpD
MAPAPDNHFTLLFPRRGYSDQKQTQALTWRKCVTYPGLSDIICQHIAQTPFSALSQNAVEATKRALLDGIGVILGASGLCPETRAFVTFARETGGDGQCSILGHGLKSSAAMAAFANGAMAHALDFEDAFDPAPSHPNASAIPAALAMVQGYGPVSGKELITALAIGCDLVCRMGLSLRKTMEESGWYPPPILGIIGATAVAARLARLNAQQARDALSLALMQASCPGEIKYSEGTVLRSVREAFPARDAVTAALLAGRDVAGFERPLEGKAGFYRIFVDGHYDPSILLDGLGAIWWGEQLSFKAWPACRGTHAYIEMGIDLARLPDFDWRRITSITVDAGAVQQMLVTPLARKTAPETVIDAKFSIPFCLALATVRGKVGVRDFNAAALLDKDVLDLARRIQVRERPDWGRNQAAFGAMTVKFADGKWLDRSVDEALGHPTRPLSSAQLSQKFKDCAGHAAKPLPPEKAEEMAKMLGLIESSEDVGRSLTHFFG